jgi:aspartokinase-like uncharacterized kinase
MSGRAVSVVRVVKVGGSLFDWPELPDALRSWLAREPPALNVLLAGGGELAEAIRRADATLHIGEEAAHWLCIDALSITARLLAGLIGGEWFLVHKLAVLKERIAVGSRETVVFDPREFLVHDEPGLPGEALPRNWSVTSDSIAARLAVLIGAEELVLLKSADAPPSLLLSDFATAGYVDRYFPQAMAEAKVRLSMLNLRNTFALRE